MGAWIETSVASGRATIVTSHPTWVRGLKLALHVIFPLSLKVAPYVGAWIETILSCELLVPVSVAPYVGAWIETFLSEICALPRIVAPYVGAWIET